MAREPSSIRTVAIVGQGGVGKTSVADALLFAGGANTRLGRVDEESSLFDTEPEELRRRSTITSSLFSFEWKKHGITLIDTPGQGNFVTDAYFALRGAAAAVLVLDASSPLRAETMKLWAWLEEEQMPALVFVNRLDRSEVDLEARLNELEELTQKRTTLLSLPLGAGDELRGVVDLRAGRALVFSGEDGKATEQDVPSELADRVEELRAKLMEDAAEGDDALVEKYLEEGELGEAEVLAGLRAAVRARQILPVLVGSAARNIGLGGLLEAIVELLPAPVERGAESAVDADGNEVTLAPDPSDPVLALVFKTIIDPHAGQLSVVRLLSGTLSGDTQLQNTVTGMRERVGNLLRLEGKKTTQVQEATVGEIVAVAKLKDTHTGDTLADPARPWKARPLKEFTPVITFAVAAKKRGEEDKAAQGLMRLAEEDPALQVTRDEGSGEILLSGAGQLHVEVACEKLERKYGVGVELKAPKVPYRETIRKSVKAHGRLKKQTGGHGQFADCWIEVEPLPRGGGFEFVDKIVGGVIPKGFIPAVEKGVREAMAKGSIAGYPVVDVKVTLYDGQHHEVDSSEMAFKIAGSMAFKAALEQAKPCLLEPYVTLEVTVPDECMGDVMGDLNARRAKVEGMEQVGHNQRIRAKVPMAEVLRYAPDLTSLTSGRGTFEMSFSHYEQLPDHLVPKVVEEARRREEEASA
ncbi:MAG: elongation factor G [Candidatus Dadabacteria bacterium]|nr:MAG: elongation factor G [Candidatus Dadabacteria bacterium]